MKQSRFMSFIESSFSIMIGFMVALLTQGIIFPIYDIDTSLSDNMQIAALFTIVSLVRSYAVRRLFNKL